MEFAEDQASSRIELDDGRVLTKCDQCRSMYAERNPPEEPPCYKCRVDLLDENEDAANIYMLCRSQVILTGTGELLDLKFEAVKAMMDLQGIKNQKECFVKVYRTFHHFLKEKKNESG